MGQLITRGLGWPTMTHAMNSLIIESILQQSISYPNHLIPRVKGFEYCMILCVLILLKFAWFTIACSDLFFYFLFFIFPKYSDL